MSLQANGVAVTTTASLVVTATGRGTTEVVVRQTSNLNTKDVYLAGSSTGGWFTLPADGTPVYLTLDKGDELWTKVDDGTSGINYIANNK